MYRRFLFSHLPVPFEDQPSHQRQHKWFLHDGEPTHFVRIFRHRLNQAFGGQWIGHGGSVNWPARHLDLTSGFLAAGTFEDFGIFKDDR